MLLFQSVFPLSTALWWYPTTYVVFLFLQPFLQKAFLGFEKQELATLTVVMLVLWSVTSCIPFFDYGFTNLIGFIMQYAVVFWVKKYGKEMMERKWILRVVFLSGMLLALLSILVMDLIGTKIPLAAQYSCYFIRGNGRVLPMVISVSFFLLCVTWNIRSRIINIAASSTFGIYLIHMYPLVKTYLFENLFNFKKYADTSYLALLALGEALLIFLMFMGIELARQCGARFITKMIKMVRGTHE
jgi:hypothetical protein